MSSSSNSSDPSDSESESNTSENNVLEVNSQEKKDQPDTGVTKKSADKDDNESPPQNSKSSTDKDKDSEDTDSDESSEEESNSESMDKSIPNQPIEESQTKDTKQPENSDLKKNPSEKSDENNSDSEKESKSEKDSNKEEPQEEHSEKAANKEQAQNENDENDQNSQNQVTEPEQKDVKSDKQIEEPSEKSSEPSQNDKKADSENVNETKSEEQIDQNEKKPDSEKEKSPSEVKTDQKSDEKVEEQNESAPISSNRPKKVSTDDSKTSPESSTRKSKRKSQEDSELDSSQSKKKSQKTSKSSERKSDTKESPKSSRSSKSPKSKDRGSNVGSKPDSENGEKSDSRSEEQIEKEMEREDAEIEAVYQFNTHKNVQKLCSYFNAEETPEGIAHVIRTTKGLNGSIIGDYLGKKENSQILIAYFMELDLKCHFIEAMRRSLSGPMFMPGEGQIIDHIIQTFSDCYINQNPQYKNPNELFVLSFALVMLNSDLHNPNNPRPMTEKQFIENTKHSLSSNDFTDKELAEMYNEIKAHEFLFTTHTNDFWWEVAPKIRGYLEKKSERAFSKWTKEFFVLTNSCLYYFKDDSPENAGNPLGVIQLTEVEVDADSKNPRFIRINAVHNEISYVKFRKIPKAVKGIKRITFKAPDRASASKWLHRLKKSAIMTNFLGDKMNDNNPPTNAKM